jgi:hypothetical protein
VPPDVYTDDVRAWTPAICTSSLAELMAEFDRRDDAFSDIELGVAPLEVGGDYACAEWSVTMTHTGQLAVDRGRMVKPTGARVTLHGIAVAEFRGDRICSLRQYWDELTASISSASCTATESPTSSEEDDLDSCAPRAQFGTLVSRTQPRRRGT